MILVIEKKLNIEYFQEVIFHQHAFLSTKMHFAAKIDSRKTCDGDNDRKLKDIKNI